MAGNHSLDGLMKWSNREEWQEAWSEVLGYHIGIACAEIDIEPDDLPSLIDEQQFMAVWACAFEDFISSETEDGRNIIDDYVKRRGWKEAVPNRNYMLALRGSIMSLYEISDIVPNESFLARDLIRGGDPIHVSEKAGTRSLRQWDRIAARIVQVGARTQMAGGVLLFDYETSEEVLNSIREVAEKAWAATVEEAREAGMTIDETAADHIAGEIHATDELLGTSAFLFTNAWLGNLLSKTLGPMVPELHNSDGEPLLFIAARFSLATGAPAEVIATALNAHPSLETADATLWNWFQPEGRSEKAQPADQALRIVTFQDGASVLGNIELKDGSLILSVNSESRLERGRALLEGALSGLLGEPVIERQTIEEMRAAVREQRAENPLSLAPDEARAISHNFLTEHYRETLDRPVLMLGNATPREAVKTEEGRAQVVGWLKMLENHTAHRPDNEPMATYDFGWLWEELGVADRRW